MNAKDLPNVAEIPNETDGALRILHTAVHVGYREARENGEQVEYPWQVLHEAVIAEMHKRGLEHPPIGDDDLDEQTAKLLQASAALPDWIDRMLKDSTDQVLVPSYVSLVGSTLDKPDPKDLDVLIRDDLDRLHQGFNESVLLTVRETLRKELGKTKVHLLGNPQGPHVVNDRPYVPLFDLVLRPRKQAKATTGSIKADGQPQEQKHDGVMIALIPSDPEALAVPGHMEPSDLHITLVYLGKVDDLPEDAPGILMNAADMYVAPALPLTATIAGLGELGDEGAQVALVNIPGIDVVRLTLCERLVEQGVPPQGKGADSFIPHMSLAYSPDGTPIRPRDLIGKEFEIEKCIVSIGEQTYTYPTPEDDAPVTAAALETFVPGKPYTLTKPHMLGYTDFVDVSELWDNWGEQALKESGALYVSPKMDGLRTSNWNVNGEKHIWSEDYKRDFSKLKPIAPLLDALSEECVIEGEMMVTHNGKFIARPQIASFLSGSLEGEPHVFLYDILHNGRDIHAEPWSRRVLVLQAVAHKLGSNYSFVPQARVTSKEQLEEAAKRYATWGFPGEPAVEGVVVRMASQDYKFGPDSRYAKIKKYLEIKARVLTVNKTQNGFTYEIGAAQNDEIVSLGKTFVSKAKLANVGDTLNVSVEEILLSPDGTIATGKPTPLGIDRSRGPYKVKQIVNLARRFKVLKVYAPNTPVTADSKQAEATALNWEEHWQEAMPLDGKSHPFVLHAHFRGLQKDDVSDTYEQLNAKKHSLHYDLRLGTDRFAGWFGVTIEGDRDKLATFVDKPDSGFVMRTSSKQFGPESWLRIGLPKPHIAKPGDVGAYPDTFAKFLAIDHGTWHLGFARKHAVEIWIDEAEHLNGRYMWQFAPLGDERVWVLTRPADQKPYAKTHRLNSIVSELKSKGQDWLVWPKDPDDLHKGMDLIDVRKFTPKP